MRRGWHYGVPLRLEPLEVRCLLSGVEWLVRLEGLGGTTRDEQLLAATELFRAADLQSEEIQAVDNVGVPDVVVVKIAEDADQDWVMQRLHTVTGFAYIELFDEEADPTSRLTWFPESPDEEEEEREEELEREPDEEVDDEMPPGFSGPLGGSGAIFEVNGFDGIIAGQAGNSRPPDSDGAVGPFTFIEQINTAIAIYDKATGALIPGA